MSGIGIGLELKLIWSSGIGIGIKNNGIGIELKKWNWPQPCSSALVVIEILSHERQEHQWPGDARNPCISSNGTVGTKSLRPIRHCWWFCKTYCLIIWKTVCQYLNWNIWQYFQNVWWCAENYIVWWSKKLFVNTVVFTKLSQNIPFSAPIRLKCILLACEMNFSFIMRRMHLWFIPYMCVNINVLSRFCCSLREPISP